MVPSDRVAFTCDGTPVEVAAGEGSSLLDVLRDELHLTSVKDGCAPQGQCGCCTVLVDGDPRVACVTPVARVAGRTVTTVAGLDPGAAARLTAALVATGGSQCGFCTPGIVVRAAWLLGRGPITPAAVDRALAAHLCRCTGWNTIRDAIGRAAAVAAPATVGSSTGRGEDPARDLAAAASRAALEGGVDQRVGPAIVLGDGGFADDHAPPGCLVAVPLPPGSDADAVEAVGMRWVVAPSLPDARGRAGKVQGRRTTRAAEPPLALPRCPEGGVRLATGWVEPAYLEPDASWCAPGEQPASPLANGGAFGGKVDSVAPLAARDLAARLQQPVRVVLSREDVVRLGPKRPPIAAAAVVDGEQVRITGEVVGDASPDRVPLPYDLDVVGEWRRVEVRGPPTSPRLRAWPLAELTVLVEGAIAEAAVVRAARVRDERAASALLDTCAREPASGALAGARVVVDSSGARVERVEVRVAAGDPLDEIVLRSYCVGAVHMALGWVLTEGIAVDGETGEVLDLTIRSFGILPARAMPPVDVTILDDPGPARARASDAVFAAVAAATWNALTDATGARPESFPALGARASTSAR